jgi:hypothetical protein
LETNFLLDTLQFGQFDCELSDFFLA